jgi:hypothetical protein
LISWRKKEPPAAARVHHVMDDVDPVGEVEVAVRVREPLHVGGRDGNREALPCQKAARLLDLTRGTIAGRHVVAQAGHLGGVPPLSAAELEPAGGRLDAQLREPVRHHVHLATHQAVAHRGGYLLGVLVGQVVEVILGHGLACDRQDRPAPADEGQQAQRQGVPGGAEAHQRNDHDRDLRRESESVELEDHARASDAGTEGKQRGTAEECSHRKHLGGLPG